MQIIKKPNIFEIFSVKNSFKDRILWGSKLLNIDDQYVQTMGEGVRVAVLDTGVDYNHLDLWDAVRQDGLPHKSFVGGDIMDKRGHGTFCAGIIGGRINDQGIVGVAPECSIMVCKVLNDNGSGSMGTIAAGIIWAAKNGANVINMSLGSEDSSHVLKNAVKCALKINDKLVIVAAAGNDGTKNPKNVNYPAAYAEVISVGAVTKNSQWASFSTIGPNLDFAAPGHGIYSTYPNNKYKVMSGTSFAAPFVSGICALIIAKEDLLNKKLKVPMWKYLKGKLQKMCVDLGAVGRDPKYGFGLVKFEDLDSK